MNNRETTVALCGAIVGLLVGSGTLLFARDVSLVASLGEENVSTVAFIRDLSNTPIVMPRGNALRRAPSTTEELHRRAASSSSSITAEPAEEVVTDVPMHDCELITKATEKFNTGIDAYIPVNLRNIEMRNSLKGVVRSLKSEYCNFLPRAHGASTASSSVAPVTTIDNDCEQYGRMTARYATCLSQEQAGRVYP